MIRRHFRAPEGAGSSPLVRRRSARAPRHDGRRLRIKELESRTLLALVPLTVDINRVALLHDDPDPAPFDDADWYAHVTIGNNAPWQSPEVSQDRVDVNWSVTRPVDTDAGVVRVDIQLFDEDPGDDYLMDISSIAGRKHVSLLINLADGTYFEEGTGSGGMTEFDDSTAGDGDASTAAVFFDIDTDGDGLFNRWELYGYDVNKDGVIDLDLPSPGGRCLPQGRLC